MLVNSKSGKILKFYFAASIRGGRQMAKDYQEIIGLLSKYGEVLTEHIGDKTLTKHGEVTRTDKEIYNRDVSWIVESDIVVAEVTVASLGVGYELAYAEAIGKKVICLYRYDGSSRLSAMVAGNDNFAIIEYEGVGELEQEFCKILAST